MSKPVVLIAEELSPATIAVLGDNFEIRHCDGANRAELLLALASANAVLVRSATKMDAEAIAAAPNLKVIARAGVGLDNVDIPAATAAKVLVVNAPTSNIVSAAELAVSLLLAVARNVVPANLALKNGQWKRSQFGGVELQGKTVGIIGMGKIGMLVAQRLAGFDMKFVAYDPYVKSAPSGGPEINMVSLDELLAASDFVTIHIPKTPETAGLIDSAALAKMKPTAFVINAARGGVLDEAALFEALTAGTIAGAGLDVYATEPCTDSPLFGLDNVVATPHLGASTEEAQEKAGVAVAESVVAAFAGLEVPGAVNAQLIN
jgi:D-3-phosphoglycerate dehydrogenase / 2-oxoglutarate reductase